MSFVAMFVVASGVMPKMFTNSTDIVNDSLAHVDSLNKVLDAMLGDSLNGSASSTKHGVDTTMMDSIELAIYKRNKAIDDSIALDSINRRRKNGIDAPVVYSGNDSMVYYASSKTAHIYGDAKVDYENMKLESEIVHVSLDSSIVRAEGIEDSLGVKSGTPIFDMAGDHYESEKMAFNFKTKKGLINNVYTEQEDGFMTSTLSKRDSTGAVYMQKGRYTTCDEEHPDFYIALTRAKVRPGKDVIFGPAYLVVADVPLPLAIPYGFFPFSKNYSSGFIMPTYGDETSRGFFLRDGGYYFALSDKMDLKLTGDIYTKGSWAIKAATSYRKRYKFNGNFSINLQTTVYGEKGLPDYEKNNSFSINWTHNQESTASPQRFGARVSFETSSFERNNLTAIYNPIQASTNTRSSSVNWSTSFSSIGLSINSSATVTQTLKDSTISISLPDLTLDLAQFYPFKRKKMVGEERWYEKIYVKWGAKFNASINTKENKLLKSSFAKDWSQSIHQSISTGSSFTLMKYINVSPSFSLNDDIYLTRQNKYWDETTMAEKTDTVSCFGNVYNWQLGMNISTSLYGFFVPSRKIFGDKIMAIRHVLKPTVTLSYAPDFSSSAYGFYGSYSYTDKDGALQTVQYKRYANSSVSNQMTGKVSFSLDNNLEMKVKSDKDTTGFKKISLIDQLKITSGYNFAATTRPWDDLTVDIHVKWFKNFDFSTQARFATYAYEVYDDNGTEKVRIGERTEYSYGRFGRYQGISQNFTFNLTPDKIRKWFHPELRDKDKKKNKNGRDDDEDEDDEYGDPNADKSMLKGSKSNKHEKGGKASTDSDGYMAFSMPWSFNINYSIGVAENTSGTFNKKTMRYPYKFTQRLSFSGNLSLSAGWNISFQSGYDFDYRKLSPTTASLSRDLHCFAMSCTVNLYPQTSYMFNFRCNAATLADALKYDKQGSVYSNNVKWY